MHFKIVRLTTIRYELKLIMSISGGLGFLQMVSKPDIGQCVNDHVGLPRGVNCEISYCLKRGT